MSHYTRIFICEIESYIEIVEIFYEVSTDPYSQDDSQSVFFCHFWHTIHPVECRIGTYTAKFLSNDREVCIDRRDIYFIFITRQFILVFVGIVADTVEFFWTWFHFARTIYIAPPRDICDEECCEEDVFGESFLEHEKIGERVCICARL